MDDKIDVVKNRNRNTPVMFARAILGIALGGLAGFGLYRYVGCASGVCLITSSPWGSVGYCMILGFVVSQIRWPNRFADRCRANRNLSNADTQQPQNKELDL
jgi:hypothetical protein